MNQRIHHRTRRIFDFHTHILPGMDDGSQSVEESLAMIEELKRQGASGIAATPHFYAHRSSPERFFSKRQAAWEQLKPHLPEDIPEIRLGAEVQYFEGIHRFDGLDNFRIEGTRLLLLEMPMDTWTSRMISSVLDINSHASTTVLLAHIERYLTYRNQKAIEELLEYGVLMQANAEFFIKKRRKAVKMLKKGQVHLLGTDAHNMDNRPPNLDQAIQNIMTKNGMQALREVRRREVVSLNEAKSDRNHP